MAKRDEAIKVGVVDYGRSSLYMRYTDPVTRKHVTRSTGTTKKREAERVAAKWEAELREGRYAAPSRTTWADFWRRYELEVLDGLAVKTAKKSLTVRNVIEKAKPVERLSEINADWISGLLAILREKGTADATVDGYMSHFRAALAWAADVGMISAVPKIRRVNRVKGFRGKGRPISGEEFERLLAAVPRVVGDDAADSWRFYLRGLWWGGLRLAESLELWWDRSDRLCVDLSGRRPMLSIPGEHEKGARTRLLPIVPEFAEMLLAVPEADRVGRVFNPQRRCHEGERLSDDRVCRLVSEMGERAGVKVWTHPKTGAVKFASAHDLRRSFGFRWSQRVMPAVLMQLMRHENVETTMQFYVGTNADATADTVWAAFGNTSGNTPSETLVSPRV